MQTYTPTIGLEVHVELKTATKMFCGSRNAPHESAPNSHICPICMGHPGTLPTINLQAVQHVLMVGRAVEGTLATYTEFDRKNYFYPDIPKGYQISQYAYPLVRGGSLADVALTRIHLEEDTARSLHDRGAGSLIDYNRAGVPLMELVTEPVIHDAAAAGTFARELQLLLRRLGVSDANMERGELRVEANVSVSATETLGTKVEVKNLNSFRSLERAIAFEVARQIAQLEEGKQVQQETRGWDEVAGKTVEQRKKESSHDYRYFPDPDLPKLNIGQIPELSITRLDEMMPEIPSKIRRRLGDLGLPSSPVEILIAQEGALELFDGARRALEEQKIDTPQTRLRLAHYITSDLVGYIQEHPERRIADGSAQNLANLMDMVGKEAITSRVAKDILAEVVFEGKDPVLTAQERGLLQKSGREELVALADAIIADHRTVVAEYRQGKEASLQFLIGQGMKATSGTANPKVLREILTERISALND